MRKQFRWDMIAPYLGRVAEVDLSRILTTPVENVLRQVLKRYPTVTIYGPARAEDTTAASLQAELQEAADAGILWQIPKAEPVTKQEQVNTKPLTAGSFGFYDSTHKSNSAQTLIKLGRQENDKVWISTPTRPKWHPVKKYSVQNFQSAKVPQKEFEDAFESELRRYKAKCKDIVVSRTRPVLPVQAAPAAPAPSSKPSKELELERIKNLFLRSKISKAVCDKEQARVLADKSIPW